MLSVHERLAPICKCIEMRVRFDARKKTPFLGSSTGPETDWGDTQESGMRRDRRANHFGSALRTRIRATIELPLPISDKTRCRKLGEAMAMRPTLSGQILRECCCRTRKAKRREKSLGNTVELDQIG